MYNNFCSYYLSSYKKWVEYSLQTVLITLKLFLKKLDGRVDFCGTSSIFFQGLIKPNLKINCKSTLSNILDILQVKHSSMSLNFFIMCPCFATYLMTLLF